jgi:hypothetical protein
MTAFRMFESKPIWLVLAAAAGALGTLLPAGRLAAADPAPNASEFTVADGRFSLAAPAAFKRVRPRSMMVETEFSLPPMAGDEGAGRLTVMGAGGSIEANIDRWIGQFSQPDGSATKDKAAVKKLKVAGCSVTLVDVTGTYKDMPGGPFAGGRVIERPDYRMLAAIIETGDSGNYFLKLYGPAKTVGNSADGFRKMVEGMVATGSN